MYFHQHYSQELTVGHKQNKQFFLGQLIVSDSVDVPNENTIDRDRIQLASSSSGTISLDQVKYQYVPKAKCDSQVDTSDTETSAASTARDDELSIEDLMAKMKQM